MIQNMVFQVACSAGAVYMFTMLLEIPRKHAFNASLLGGLNWLVYLIVMEETGSVMGASFTSSLLVAILGQLLARVQKAPAILFLVAGILPTVPGAAIYRSVYYFIQDNQQLFSYYLLETMQIAGAIAMAIFVTDSLMRVVLEYQNNWKPTAK